MKIGVFFYLVVIWLASFCETLLTILLFTNWFIETHGMAKGSLVLHTKLAQLHIWLIYMLVIFLSIWFIFNNHFTQSFKSDKNRKWSTVFIRIFLAPIISGSNWWLWKSAPETYTGTQTRVDLLGVTGTSQSNLPTLHLVWPRNYMVMEINASMVEFHLAITLSDWYSSFICHNFLYQEIGV